MKTLNDIENEITIFKSKIADFTKWNVGKDIRDFISINEALIYGRLLGKRDILEEQSKGGL